MEIRLPSSLLPTQLSPKGVANLLAQLKPGQNLVAVVETQLAENNFLLKLADTGQQLRARSQLALNPGQVLKLEVIKLGALPELRILPPPTDESPQAGAVQLAFRQFLPKQIGLADLTAGLRQALGELPDEAAKPLPEPVRQAARMILDNMTSPAKLATPEGLKQAIRDSGVFLEAKLASQPEAMKALAGGDFKGRLLALVDSLTQAQAKASGPDSMGKQATQAGNSSPAHAPSTTTGLSPAPTPEQKAAAAPGPQTPSLLTPPGDGKPGPESPASPPQASEPPSREAAAQTQAAPGPMGEEGKPIKAPVQETVKVLASEVPDLAAGGPEESRQTLAPESANAPRAPAPGPGQSLPPDTPEGMKMGDQSPATEAAPGQAAAFPKPPTDLPHLSARDDTAIPDSGRMPELKELLQKSEGALARVVLDQLASLPQNDGKQIAWQLEIPFLQGGDPGSARMKIVREERSQGGEGEQAFWSVVLSLEPPGLGTVHSRITLVGERIDTYFWTDRAATCGLIGEHLDLLSARFKQAGLEVGQVAALPGGAPEEGSGRKSGSLPSLVDEKA